MLFKAPINIGRDAGIEMTLFILYNINKPRVIVHAKIITIWIKLKYLFLNLPSALLDQVAEVGKILTK